MEFQTSTNVGGGGGGGLGSNPEMNYIKLFFVKTEILNLYRIVYRLSFS